jgi:hypothetical protein
VVTAVITFGVPGPSAVVACQLVDSSSLTALDSEQVDTETLPAQLTLLGSGQLNAGDTVAVQCQTTSLGAYNVAVHMAAIEVGSLNGS